MFRLNSPKNQLITFLSFFAICLSILNNDTQFIPKAFFAVAIAVAFELVLSYPKDRKFIISESAVISGLIIGYVLSSDQPFWKFALAAILAIGSKHLIRFKKKHIFNPAGFAIFSIIILFQAQTEWHGMYLWYILAPAGVYFAYKIRKQEILMGYSLVALGLFGGQAIMQKNPLLGIFGYLNYFYVSIMLIEPKTTPVNPVGKIIFGAGIAVLVFILIQSGVRFDAELCALLILNIAVPLLNELSLRKRGVQ